MQDVAIVEIPGVVVRKGQRFDDHRGWLAECFRSDEIDRELLPEMSYISVTLPGITRGPHEHLHQTDYFCFVGTSTFKIYLWDNRKASPAHGERMTILANEGAQMIVIVPPGIVHAYQNVGDKAGMVLNFPNKLYAGAGKKDPIDEIRYEDAQGSLFKVA